jgi:hypothetical protein
VATIHLSKANVYVRLARLNRAFEHISDNLTELRTAAIFNRKQLSTFVGLTAELQSEINHELTESLRDLEYKDAFKFGKIRIARDEQGKP